MVSVSSYYLSLTVYYHFSTLSIYVSLLLPMTSIILFFSTRVIIPSLTLSIQVIIAYITFPSLLNSILPFYHQYPVIISLSFYTGDYVPYHSIQVIIAYNECMKGNNSLYWN